MSFESNLVTWLDSKPAIVALIAGRRFPVKAPQGAARPLLIYRRDGGGHEYHQAGKDAIEEIDLELECQAETYEGAKTLAAAIAASAPSGLSGYAGTFGTGHLQFCALTDQRDESESPLPGRETTIETVRLQFTLQYVGN